MTTQYAISTRDLGKCYQIDEMDRCSGSQMLQTALLSRLKGLFFSGASRQKRPFWALKGIDLDVAPGEVLGLIGHNGAGKSTLLKVLSRITNPTTGIAHLQGRVGALLEVGTGFHPELTGRENIFLSGAVLGMKRDEIHNKFDEIVEFAGIEQFLHMPVKRYSTGMYVRLAFAVAAHLEPEILLIDEVLAVGDASFRKKCLGRMDEVARTGRTIIFVSHNMAAIKSICHKAAFLEGGEIKFLGDTNEAVDRYLSSQSDPTTDLNHRKDRKGSGEIIITGYELRDEKGRPIEAASSGQNTTLALHYRSNAPLSAERLRISINCHSQFNVPVFSHHNELSDHQFSSLPPEGTFVCKLNRLPLAPGDYRISYQLSHLAGTIDALLDVGKLVVVAGNFYSSGLLPSWNQGSLLVDAEWSVESD